MSICSQVCKQGFVYAQAQESVEKVMGKQTLSDLMLFDAITGNVDLYLGNFGVLIDNDTNEIIKPAPIFDNGRALISFIQGR
ncbi:hypothetical protein [Helicobacter heilmannii]|uniref:hypothetical protein n=1 Tax=Helicobacter heilmannii TaxID=35817 RepID=UPI0006B3735C|nr:hypothetical protein [Helicobacter heilmannii]